MEQSAAKKARVDEIYSHGMQDVLRLDAATTGGANGGSSPSGVAIVQVRLNWFRCPVCSRLLSPPVFQCKGGHLACERCQAVKCRRCKKGGGGGSFDARNVVVEEIISAAKFKCPHSGCHDFFPYPELQAHLGDCQHAPCSCTAPGCAFADSPSNLLHHLIANHSWPAHSVTYGRFLNLRAPLSEPRRLLQAEEDGRVFALVVGALGAVTAVSVVCVRGSGGGGGGPRYTAGLRARAATGSTVMTAMEPVTSSDRPGEVGVDRLPWFLPVPSTYLLAGAADGASNEVSLKICIQKISGD